MNEAAWLSFSPIEVGHTNASEALQELTIFSCSCCVKPYDGASSAVKSVTTPPMDSRLPYHCSRCLDAVSKA